MLRDEYLRRLVDNAHIELYLSANDGARIYWPWRMHPPKEANSRYRNSCEKYIIDSDPKDDTVTAKTVLDKAVEVGAEVASLQDVYLDKDATVDSLLRGFEVYDSHEFNGDLLLPTPATICGLLARDWRAKTAFNRSWRVKRLINDKTVRRRP